MLRLAVVSLFWHSLHCQTPSSNNQSRVATEDRETDILPVQYVSLAPCSCDLSEGACDFGCCCDQICSSDAVKMYFECPKTTSKSDQFVTCHQPTVVRRPALSLFLCSLRVNTPYLGHFFNNVPVLRTQVAYAEKTTASRQSPDNANGGYQAGINDTMETLSKPAYSYGAAIGVSTGSDGGFLRLPTAILDHSCSAMNPVRFLIGQRTVCLHTVTNATCEADGYLKATSYLTNSVETQENRTGVYHVLRNEQGGFAPVRVNYLCRTRQNILGNVVSIDQSYLFAERPVEPRSSETLGNCEFPSGSVPNPLLTGAAVCTNVVQSVQYDIFWNASFVINVTATIILGAVETSSAALVKQEFTVNWLHAYDLAESGDSAGFGSRAPYPRSGNPGYDFGRPLISAGTADLDGMGAISDENQAFTWVPDSTALCAFAGRHRVNFGENETSGCFVQLLKDSFLNCDSLRSTVNAAMERLFPITFISKFGSIPSNSSSLENFVPILRLPLSQNDSVFDLISAIIPEGNDTNMLRDLGIVTINGTTSFTCKDIPTSVTLDIFYAESGVVNQISVYEVVGALLFFNFSTWRFATKNPSQRFFVSSNVRYYKKPPGNDAGIKSFYLKRGRFHCPGPTCWDDLLFAFRRRDDSGIDYSYTLTVGLSAIIGLIIIYIVTNPWAV